MSERVKLIQKLAQDIPVRPGGPKGGTVVPVKSTDTSAVPVRNTAPSAVQQGIPAVKEMQQAMQVLAFAVMRDSNTATMAAKPLDALQPGATPDVIAAKKGFNDFIAEQYLGGLDDSKKGVEWTTDREVTTYPGKSKTQTDIYELDAVMDTLRRIGIGTNEFRDDGVWGFRTDNALRNMLGFAYALLQLEGDFGLQNPHYTLDNWKEFSSLLSGYQAAGGKIDLSPEEQTEKASGITKHLKAVTNLYNQFRQQVTARPEFRPLLEGKRSFEKYDPVGTSRDALSQQEEALVNSPTARATGVRYQAPDMPGGNLAYIPLSALKSKEDFEKFLKSIGWEDENIEGGIAPKLLKSIKQQLESK